MRSLFWTALLVGAAQAQLKFERCSFIGSDRDELCFKVKPETIRVTIGDDGTDDNVNVQICSDRNVEECCTTPALKSLLFDDWSKNSQEDWGPKYLGDGANGCKGKTFNVQRGFTVTLSKSGTDSLKVVKLDVDTRAAQKGAKETERFVCGQFQLGSGANANLNKLTKFCKAGPFDLMRVSKATFRMGDAKDDGTNDDVSVRIASDVDAKNDCKIKLSGLLSDDWSRGDTETWDKDDFKKCGKQLYKVQDLPQISLTKTGRDSLVVASADLEFDVIDSPPRKIKFRCDGFKLDGQCGADGKFCTKTLQNCRKTDGLINDSALNPANRASTRNSNRNTGFINDSGLNPANRPNNGNSNRNTGFINDSGLNPANRPNNGNSNRNNGFINDSGLNPANRPNHGNSDRNNGFINDSGLNPANRPNHGNSDRNSGFINDSGLNPANRPNHGNSDRNSGFINDSGLNPANRPNHGNSDRNSGFINDSGLNPANRPLVRPTNQPQSNRDTGFINDSGLNPANRPNNQG